MPKIFDTDGIITSKRAKIYKNTEAKDPSMKYLPDLDLIQEWEKDIVSGTSYTFPHALGNPVRWYVVGWGASPGGATPTTDPHLVESSSSDSNNLVLTANATGRVCVRIEPKNI